MAFRYLLESGAPDGYRLEDNSGVYILEGDEPEVVPRSSLSMAQIITWAKGDGEVGPEGIAGTVAVASEGAMSAAVTAGGPIGETASGALSIPATDAGVLGAKAEGCLRSS